MLDIMAGAMIFSKIDLKSGYQIKIHANTRRRHMEFQVRDYFMIRVRPKRFPSRIIKILHARSVGPFKILKQVV